MDSGASNKFATQMAIASFGFGTLLFIAYQLLPESGPLFLAALCYILVAIVLNFIMVVYLTIGFVRYPAERQEIAIRILLILSNIPIALLYTYVTLTSL